MTPGCITIRGMASGKTLTPANLEALGAARLAALLIELGAGDPAIKRRLRLALAANAGPAEAARLVGKRLAGVASARSHLDWQRVKALAAELEAQRRAILELVAPADPREAFELAWRLVGCAESVLARSDDGNGALAEIFQRTMDDLGVLARAAGPDPAALAQRIFEALRQDSHAVWEGLVPILAAPLGATGLGVLKGLVQAWQAAPVPVLPAGQRRVIGWSSSGAIHADEIEASHRRNLSGFVLREIAAALGDVDLYAAQFDRSARTMPRIAADIAQHLLEASRAPEAWTALEAAAGERERMPAEWRQARIATLEALNRPEEAQALRWACLAETLEAGYLRDVMRRLPDFEDFEAEQRGLALALGHRDAHRALALLVGWPDLPRADRLVRDRAGELDGNRYEVLSGAADALQAKHPLAATLLRRAMIDHVLGGARSSRYGHAARHLIECAGMARHVGDFGTIPDHAAYEQALRAAHGRKAAFWQEVQAFHPPPRGSARVA